jgi:predicted HAD superfamily phosphohydrolase YqeG
MIRAMIFDLDGTLVKTERLKATPFTRDWLLQGDLLDWQWIVDEPDDLLPTVRHFVALQ